MRTGLAVFRSNGMFTCMEAEPDPDLISSITPDVMTCLERSGFFRKLDDLLRPEDHSLPHADCRADYELSKSILQEAGFDSSELTDIFGVLRSQEDAATAKFSTTWSSPADSRPSTGVNMLRPVTGVNE